MARMTEEATNNAPETLRASPLPCNTSRAPINASLCNNDEGAWALSDYVTNNEIELGPNGSDWLSQRALRRIGLDTLSVNYLITKAEADNKSPARIIDELVQKELAAGA